MSDARVTIPGVFGAIRLLHPARDARSGGQLFPFHDGHSGAGTRCVLESDSSGKTADVITSSIALRSIKKGRFGSASGANESVALSAIDFRQSRGMAREVCGGKFIEARGRRGAERGAAKQLHWPMSITFVHGRSPADFFEAMAKTQPIGGGQNSLRGKV